MDGSNLNGLEFPLFTCFKNHINEILEGKNKELELGYSYPGGKNKLRELIAEHKSYLEKVEITAEDVIVNGAGATGVINFVVQIIKEEHLRCSNNPTATLISTIRNKKLYLTIDTDFFDPSIAPATNNPEHGGMLYEETLDILKALCGRFEVVGADVVEFNPLLDIADTTGLLVTNLIMELMSYICNV